MRKKYNENVGNIQKTTPERSNIFLKSKENINALLATSIESQSQYTYEELYVPNTLSKELSYYLNKQQINHLVYLTGLTGTGKTSLLKYVFRHFSNTYEFLDKTLIIPFACDGQVGETFELKKKLANMFFGVTNVLCENYGLEQYNEDVKGFYEYIKKRRVQYSVNQNSWRKATPEEIIDQLYQKYPLELSLLAFKYTMCQKNNPINNVVFIMDDLESVGVNKEVFPIYLANKIKLCLDNLSSDEKGKWSCTTIIGCRHYVYRIFDTRRRYIENDDRWLELAELDRTTMESFSGEELDIGECVSLIDIITTRKNSIIKKLSGDDEKDFEEICKVLINIVEQVGELILSLNINDYRRTFSLLKSIIYNKRWIQKYDSNSGAFKIGTAAENYNTKLPNVMRAVALGENNVYFGEKSIIPNLLQNKKEEGYDLWIVLNLAHFILSANDSSWDESIELRNIREKINILFGDDELKKDACNEAIDFLIIKRLLLRGKRQEQRDSTDLKDNNLDHIKYVYLSNAAKMLWNNLGTSSILFEIFIDDVWIENPTRKQLDYGKRYNLFNNLNFNECLNYLQYLIKEEIKIRRYIKSI